MDVEYNLLKAPRSGVSTCARILVDFVAVSETLIGVCLTLTGIGLIGWGRYLINLTLICVGLILLSKATLLLYGIIKGHAKCILIYLVISVPLLLIVNGSGFYVALILFFNLPYDYGSILLPTLGCVYLVIMSVLAWSTQFSIFIIYKQLIPSNRATLT